MQVVQHSAGEGELTALERQRNHNRGLANELMASGHPVMIPPADITLVQFLAEKLSGPVGSDKYTAFMLEYETRLGAKFDEAMAEVRRAKLQEAILPAVVRDLRGDRRRRG